MHKLHTPGPWHHLGPSIGLALKGQGGEADQLICIANLPDPLEFDEREWLANANLISAAPDLLEALEWTKQAFLSGDDWSMTSIGTCVDKALAKAKGK